MAALDLIPFVCPTCKHTTQVPAMSAGSSITCPACKSSQSVPVPAPAATAAAAAPAVSFTPSSGNPIVDDGKKLFICTCCNYRARIPAQYLGMAVRCPSCDAPQIASGDENAIRSGRTVSINKLQTAASAAKMSSIRPGNILYTCNLCGFEAQLAQNYLGKAIRCPGCHAAQVVAEGVTAKVPGTTADAPPAPPIAPPATPPPPGTSVPPAGTANVASNPPTTHDGQPLFVCSACGYRARIPEQYLGLAVTCPSCEVVQIANQQNSEQPSTGNTQRLAKLKTSEPVEPSSAGAVDGSKIPFTCTACGFNTHLGSSLAGKAIRCPSCQATQVVPGKPGGSFDKPSPIPASMSAGAAPTAEKVRFTCTSCGFKARIPGHYAGQVIHCPGCNSVQLVVASSLAATGNTRVLAKVQTADDKPATPATADELKTVSSALEASSTTAASSTPPPKTPSAAMPSPLAKPASGSFPKPATAQLLTDSHKAGPDLSNRPEINLPATPKADLLAQGGVVEETPVKSTDGGGKVVRRGSTASSDAAMPAAKPAATTAVTAPAHPVTANAHQDADMPAPTPSRSSPLVGIVLGVVALAIIGGMGYVLLNMSNELKEIRRDLKQAQEKSEAANARREEADQKRQAAEKIAEADRVAAAKRIEEMQRQLKEAESKAAQEKLERERAEKERAEAAAKAAATPTAPRETAPAETAPAETAPATPK